MSAPDYNPYFYYEDADKVHTVWFLDVRHFSESTAGRSRHEGRRIRALSVRHGRRRDLGRAESFRTISSWTQRRADSLEVLKGTDTITDVGEGEIVSVDESRADGRRSWRWTMMVI